MALQLKFIRLPDSSDWKRFERYSRRVRRLRVMQELPKHTLHQSVFDDVARTRTSLNILPNMSTLEWDESLPLCVMFMHDNVRRFVVHLPDELSRHSLHPFFQDVVSRMPNIAHLDLRMNISMDSIENDVLNLFHGLTKLQRIVLPRFHFTTRVAEVLSRLDDLGVVEFQYSDHQGCGDPADTQIFSPSLMEGAFPSLWDLSLSVRFEDAVHFLDDSYAPTNITVLYIDSMVSESPSVIHCFLSVVADNCQLLKSLSLISLIEASTALAKPSEDQINFETLRPLLNCANLTAFELMHQYPLDLRLEDINELASKWASLETLILNNEPALLDHSPLTLKALLPFARHCPNLRKLGLFLHASTADLPSSYQSDLPPSYECKPFKKLKTLSMGVSIILEEGPVALFLSQICPLGCKLESGVTWGETTAVDSEVARKIKGRYKKWEKVDELLPLLTKLRMEERERTRALQSEVEDLRMRTGLLMDKAALNLEGPCVML